MAGQFHDLAGLSTDDLCNALSEYLSERVALQSHLQGLRGGKQPAAWVEGDTGPYFSRRDHRSYRLDQLDVRAACGALGANGRDVKACRELLRDRGVDPDSDPRV